MLVVSPLTAVMNEQLNKLEAFLNVCIHLVSYRMKVNKKLKPSRKSSVCSLAFAHPEIYVYINSVAEMPIVHLVLQWYGLEFLLFSIDMSLHFTLMVYSL